MIRQAEEERRCLLQILYESGTSLRAKRARSIMSELGYAVFWSVFMRHVDYLASEELIYCFPAGASSGEPSATEQAKFIGQSLTLSFDAPECDTVMLRIRQRGRHFLEGNDSTVKGVAKD